MDALTLLWDQAAAADSQLMAVMKPVTPEQGQWRLPNSKANTITMCFIHVYYAEDMLISTLQGKESVFEQGGWARRIDYNPKDVWGFTGMPETAVMLLYATAVGSATNNYLASITPKTMDEMSETARGPRSRASRLSTTLVTHKYQHTGDISALLGCQGLQGLP